MKKKGVTKVSLRQRGAWGLSGAARRSLRSAPWLISAAAAWLTFFPCGTAFAAHDWRDDGSSALNGTLSFESTIPDTEKNEYGMTPASWTQNDGDAKGRVALTGVIPDTPGGIFGALVESGKGNAYESSVSLTGGSFLSGFIAGGAAVSWGTGDAYANAVTIEDSSVEGLIAGGVIYDSLGNAYGNAVSISGDSTISSTNGFGGVYGGYVYGSLGKADRNAVTMSGGVMGVPVFGGLVEYSAWGPVNLVSVAEPDPAELSPEPLDVSADNNTVAFSGVGVEISTDTLSGAGVKSDGIFGGCVRISEIYPGINVSADTNTAALSHVSASGARVYGGLIESGFAYPYPVSTSGSSDSALSSVSLSASGNSVFLEQSSAGDVYGGTIRTGGQTYAYPRFQRSAAAPEFAIIPSPTVFTAHADGNTVGIADSSAVSGDVHGGLIEYGMPIEPETPVLMMSFLVPDPVQPEAAPVVFHGSADSNTVSIAGTAGTLTVDGNVYGGIVRVSPASVDALAQSEFSVTAEKIPLFLPEEALSAGVSMAARFSEAVPAQRSLKNHFRLLGTVFPVIRAVLPEAVPLRPVFPATRSGLKAAALLRAVSMAAIRKPAGQRGTLSTSTVLSAAARKADIPCPAMLRAILLSWKAARSLNVSMAATPKTAQPAATASR